MTAPLNSDLCNVAELMTVRLYRHAWSPSLRRTVFVEVGLVHYDLATGDRWDQALDTYAREQGPPTATDYAEMHRLASDEERR